MVTVQRDQQPEQASSSEHRRGLFTPTPPTREALRRLLDALPDTELPEAARRLDPLAARLAAGPEEQALIDRWIEPDPHRPAEARVKEYGVPVWALVGHALGLEGPSDAVAQVVARAYELPVEAVLAGLAYYRRHPLQIDARLEANAAAHAGWGVGG